MGRERRRRRSPARRPGSVWVGPLRLPRINGMPPSFHGNSAANSKWKVWAACTEFAQRRERRFFAPSFPPKLGKALEFGSEARHVPIAARNALLLNWTATHTKRGVILKRTWTNKRRPSCSPGACWRPQTVSHCRSHAPTWPESRKALRYVPLSHFGKGPQARTKALGPSESCQGIGRMQSQSYVHLYWHRKAFEALGRHGDVFVSSFCSWYWRRNHPCSRAAVSPQARPLDTTQAIFWRLLASSDAKPSDKARDDLSVGSESAAACEIKISWPAASHARYLTFQRGITVRAFIQTGSTGNGMNQAGPALPHKPSPTSPLRMNAHSNPPLSPRKRSALRAGGVPPRVPPPGRHVSHTCPSVHSRGQPRPVES